MDIHQYLENRLKNSSLYQLTTEDQQYLKTKGVEEFILWKLMSKKFRKWKLDAQCLEHAKKAIHLCVAQNKPLEAGYFVGGYKLWRLPTTPEADWAEFFNISYVLQYLAPITAAYRPGVSLYYYMHTLLMEKHDNLTTGEINSYVHSFQALLDIFSEYLSKNITVRIWKDADLFPSRQAYFSKLEEGFDQAKKTYSAFSQEQKAHYRKLSELNIKWNGKEDWTRLPEKEKEEKIIQSACYELAALNLNEAAKAEDKILLFTKPSKIFIGIGSTKTSITKHWTGIGVLEKHEDSYYDRILSPSQYEKTKKSPYESIPINLIPLTNFKEIKVYPQPFDFIHP